MVVFGIGLGHWKGEVWKGHNLGFVHTEVEIERAD